MSDPASRPRDFVPLSHEELHKALLEGAKTFASAMLWIKDQEQVINTHFTLYSVKENLIHLWIPKGLNLETFPRAEWFFSVSLSSANIFFRAPFMAVINNSLAFAIPEKAFKVQRRKDVRFIIPDGHVVRVEFQDPLFPENRINKKIWDLSAGGCSFIIPTDEQVVYQKGLLLKDLRFTIRGKEIVTEAEVRHVQPFRQGARLTGSKVGILFKNIRPVDYQTIASHVFDESRKYYTRFL